MKKISNEELGRITIDEYQKSEKTPIIVVLDNVRSLNNVGSVFRTCDALRIDSIYLCGITGKPPHKDIHKTALGATDTVNWKYFTNVQEAIYDLKDKEFIVCAIEQCDESKALDKFDFSKEAKYAFIFGNEVEGVGQDVIDLVNDCIEIPQYGTKHSFNISVCAGIVLWEAFKALNKITV